MVQAVWGACKLQPWLMEHVDAHDICEVCLQNCNFAQCSLHIGGRHDLQDAVGVPQHCHGWLAPVESSRGSSIQHRGQRHGRIPQAAQTSSV